MYEWIDIPLVKRYQILRVSLLWEDVQKITKALFLKFQDQFATMFDILLGGRMKEFISRLWTSSSHSFKTLTAMCPYMDTLRLFIEAMCVNCGHTVEQHLNDCAHIATDFMLFLIVYSDSTGL